MSTPDESTRMNDTATDTPHPNARFDAALHAQWAERVLDNLPGSGSCCETTAEQLAAAQSHALLSLAARVAELIDTVRAGAGEVQGELEALRVQGISEVGISGSVVTS